MGFSFAPIGLHEVVDLPAGVGIDEFKFIGVEVYLEYLFVEFDEGHQPCVEPHLEHLPHAVAPDVGHHHHLHLLPIADLPVRHFIIIYQTHPPFSSQPHPP